MAEPIKTGNRPVVNRDRSYKPGDSLFVENENGNEMFILKEGEVIVEKNINGINVELAKLEGAGIIIGEMALLDNLPRSASVKVSKEAKVTVVNQLIFHNLLSKVPPWLKSIIKIITSRLRDANTKVGLSLLKEQELGLANLLVLIRNKDSSIIKNVITFDYKNVLDKFIYFSRVTSKEFTVAFKSLQARKLVTLAKNTEGQFLIQISDIEVLMYYIEYKHAKAKGQNILGEELTDILIEFMSKIETCLNSSEIIDTPNGKFIPESIIPEDEAERTSKITALEKMSIIEIIPKGLVTEKAGIIYKSKLFRKAVKVYTHLPNYTLNLKEILGK